MRQGEIWNLYLDPVAGSEQGGRRPAVIISGNLLNKHLKVVIVCPLTTRIKNYKGNVILDPDHQNGLKKRSEILVFHVQSVAKEKLKEKLGTISSGHLIEIKQTLDDILRY